MRRDRPRYLCVGDLDCNMTNFDTANHQLQMIISTMLLLLRVVIFVKERAYYLLVRENTNVLLLDWGEPCRHKYLWMQSGGWTM